jgi:type II secretory pathway component HofQ
MKLFSAALIVCGANLAFLAAQSAPPPVPVLVVRLDDGGGDPIGRARQVQTVEPASSSAPGRGQLQPLPVTRLEDSAASAILDAPRKLTLRFSTPQPIRQVLMMLVRGTGLSLVTSADAEGSFAGELTGVTLRQALDLVARPQGLDYRVEGNAIRVFRRETITRILDVNAIAGTREGSRAGDTFDDLAESLGKLLSPSGRLGIDRKAGLVHVTDYPEHVDRTAAYLELVERRLNRQVSIQARVIKVILTDAGGPGVNWNQAVGQARTGTGPFETIDFARLIAALGRQGTVNVLTAADVKALHNEEATIRVGVQAPEFEGFALAVTPHISADGTILLSVAPAVSEPLAESRGGAGVLLATSEVSTAVRIRDGETLVLPGIRRASSEIAVLLTTKVI